MCGGEKCRSQETAEKSTRSSVKSLFLLFLFLCAWQMAWRKKEPNPNPNPTLSLSLTLFPKSQKEHMLKTKLTKSIQKLVLTKNKSQMQCKKNSKQKSSKHTHQTLSTRQKQYKKNTHTRRNFSHFAPKFAHYLPLELLSTLLLVLRVVALNVKK